ncbi:MAG: aldo/keto reductase [Haloarculaceae archaeon]
MELPQIGLGTWQNDEPEQCAESVRTALEMGYRHVDTAEYYGNEKAVGEGIAAADVPRGEITVATKVHPHSTGLSRDAVIETARASRDRLGIDTIDLLYVHWPIGDYDAEETLGAFNALLEEGTIRHAGVSNFEPELIEEAMEILDSPPVANQVEMHPLLQQEHLVEHAQEHDYNLVAYSPLCRGDVFDVPEVVEVAEKHDASPAQVSLAWITGKDNVVAIPKSESEGHIRDNFAARELALDDEDIARIEGIDRRKRNVDYPDAPWH